MPIDRDVLEAVREMDEHELRRLYILAKARLEGRGVDLPGSGPEVKLRKQTGAVREGQLYAVPARALLVRLLDRGWETSFTLPRQTRGCSGGGGARLRLRYDLGGRQ